MKGMVATFATLEGNLILVSSFTSNIFPVSVSLIKAGSKEIVAHEIWRVYISIK